jgi:hypothetical protein
MKLKRGIEAIVSMNAASWFPLNSYTGAEKSCIVPAAKSVSCDIMYTFILSIKY